jgi:hypothetical protein
MRRHVSQLFHIKKKLKIEKLKFWEPFRSCLLNSTANSAQFWWKWAGLALQGTSKWLPGF